MRDLLDALGTAGLVQERDGAVALTAAGTARYTELRDRIGAVTARIFGQFDPARVETARGLLQEIAELDASHLG